MTTWKKRALVAEAALGVQLVTMHMDSYTEALAPLVFSHLELQAENARLREALRKLAYDCEGEGLKWSSVRAARAALEEK